MDDPGIRNEPHTLVERAADAAMRAAEEVLSEAGAYLAEMYVLVRAVEGTIPEGEEDLAQSTTGLELPEDTMERAIHIITTNLSIAQKVANDSGMVLGTMVPTPVMMSDN